MGQGGRPGPPGGPGMMNPGQQSKLMCELFTVKFAEFNFNLKLFFIFQWVLWEKCLVASKPILRLHLRSIHTVDSY